MMTQLCGPANMKTLMLLCVSLLSVAGSPLGNPYEHSHAGPPHSHSAYSWGGPPAHAGAHAPSHSYPVGHPSGAHALEHVPSHVNPQAHPRIPSYSHPAVPGHPGSSYLSSHTTPGHPLPTGAHHTSTHPHGTTPGHLTSSYASTHTSALLDAIAAHLISTHPLMQMKPAAANPHAGSSEQQPHPHQHTAVHPHAISAGAYGAAHAPAHPHPYSSYMIPTHAPAHAHGVPGPHPSSPHAPALPHTSSPHSYAPHPGHPGTPHITTQITAPGASIPQPGHYGSHADHQVSQIIDAHMQAIQQHIDSHEKAHYGKAGVSDHFRATMQSAHALASAVHAAIAAHRPAAPYAAAHVLSAPSHPMVPHGAPPSGHYPAPQPLKPVHVMAPSIPDIYESREYEVSEPGAM